MRKLMPWIAALAACGEPPREPPTRPAAVTKPAAPPFEVAVPVDFSREPALTEPVALDQIHQKLGRGVCTALRAGDTAGLMAWLTPDFRGRLVDAAKVRALPPGEPVQVGERPSAEAVLDGAGFAKGWTAIGDEFADRARCKLKPVAFKLALPGFDSAWVQLAFKLAGPGRDGKPRVLRGRWSAEVVKGADHWRLRRVDTGPLEEVVTLGAPFADVTAQVGFDIGRSAGSEQAIRRINDERAIETIGGLAVLDADGDGDDDLLAWNRRRVLALFTNDGRGGFDRRTDLLAPGKIGVFQVVVDLDGDGTRELVSTEALRCRDKTASFPVWRWRADGPLEQVAWLDFGVDDCSGHRDWDFEHIAVGDVDGDGHLDLFFSGYGTLVRNEDVDFNKFDSTSGLRNPLFLGRGGLEFEEVGRERGIEDTRLTYTATLYDYDEDGDVDLIAANDFGPNVFYVNDGKGHFEHLGRSTLTENGQSMGITVSDFDGDQRLDIYVSNMSSSAGTRIVPLFEGTLKPETYRALLGIALGNTLYVRTGKATFEQRAQALGIADAQWAWGQAYFDYDNDGDRDLYVVNGLNSHSSDREHDF